MLTKMQERNKTTITRGLAASLSVVASATVICGVFLTKQDAADAIYITLAPGSFITNSGTVDNAATSAGLLNTTAVPNGFGGFFNSPNGPTFLAVGATGTGTISASPTGVNSRTTSTFNVSAADAAASTNIFANFIYAYQGAPTGSVINDFVINLVNPSGSDKVTIFDAANGSAGYSSGTTVSNLFVNSSGGFFNFYGAGNYGFEIALTESGFGSVNTAAGFNQVLISSTPVPFDFDPSAGIAILGAGFGLNKLRKNLKAKKDLNV